MVPYPEIMYSRVALVNYEKDYGQLAVNVIIDVIDQNQTHYEAIVDSPHMVRSQMSIKGLCLTDIKIDIKEDVTTLGEEN
ncbi:hypothetical protein G4B88_003451 [Cannabis sativa]|uniref:Uncharacterized protein n=1 Tax=Cannabis sativa TaxID=3483 RepID=A0A7J6DJB6_CANSA|nr:hypothetical protein G4B88_003451 [Cannabis sativa]